MKMGKCNFRGGRYLAVAVLLLLAVGANALNVVNTHTTTGFLSKGITVTSAGTYKHDAKAPASGSLYSEIDQVGTLPADEISVANGACESNSVSLQVTDERVYYNLC